jgi:two-component system cell cycle response regulator DivK
MKHKILIVEDNELNMKLFNDLLEAHGYATVKTREGTKVLEIARANMPDLVLMDIQLPEISGLDLIRLIKEAQDLNHIPVIAITAFAMKGDEGRIRETGCEDYISKPISVVGFIETIRKHLPVVQLAQEG